MNGVQISYICPPSSLQTTDCWLTHSQCLQPNVCTPDSCIETKQYLDG